jgi:hypothetical protein
MNTTTLMIFYLLNYTEIAPSKGWGGGRAGEAYLSLPQLLFGNSLILGVYFSSV